MNSNSKHSSGLAAIHCRHSGTGFATATAPERNVLAASLHSANAASRSAAMNGVTLASGSSARAAPESSGSSSGAPW